MDNKQRIQWIDEAKGLGLMLVIIGHTLESSSFSYYLLYSFHMPWFFFLSFLTSKPPGSLSELKTKLCRTAHHLLLPALCVFLIGTAYELYFYYHTQQMNWPMFWERKRTQLIYIQPLGTIWFLITLFLARCLHDSINLLVSNTWFAGAIFIAACSLSVCCPQMHGRPLVIGAVLAALPFCFWGTIWQKRSLTDWKGIDFAVYALILFFASPFCIKLQNIFAQS
ncbi:MAG: hypothetical protein Q4F00_13505, partial [bacterium]|nr:hypothetical protein [bacterium]